MQYFGNCSEALLTNPFTNIFPMRTRSHRPLWFQSLSGGLSMWLQSLALLYQIHPSAPNQDYTDIMRLIYTKPMILIMKDKSVERRKTDGKAPRIKKFKTETENTNQIE